MLGSSYDVDLKMGHRNAVPNFMLVNKEEIRIYCL